MAPKRGGTKRPAPNSTDDAVDKKLFEFLKTQGITRATYKAIVEALEHSHLVVSDDCRKMLVTMVAKSLCVAADERHELQVQCVDMIGDAIQQVKVKMQEVMDSEQATVTTFEGGKADLERKLQEAKDVLDQDRAKLEAASKILSDASEAVLSAKATLGSKQEDQKAADAGFAQFKADKEAFDNVLENDLKKLRDGTWEDGQAKKHFDGLATLFGKFTLEDSLQAVLPGSLMKKPDERGSFDLMAVTQLEQSMQGKLSELNAALAQHGPQVQEREAVVAQAQKSYDDAVAAQKDAAGALSVAQETEKNAIAAVRAAESALASGEAELKKVAEVRDQKHFELEAFQYHIGCFDQLKERAATKITPVATEEDQEVQPAVAGA